MLLTLTASEQSYILVLPASEKQLEHAKKSLGIEEFAQAVIANAEYTAPYLNQLIPMDGITAEDANEMRVLFSQAVEDGGKYRLIFGYTEDVGRFNYGFVHGSKTKIGNLIVGWNEASQTIECYGLPSSF